MQKRFMKKFKLFFVWEHEKEEEWLTYMSSRGYRLLKASVGFYTFEICDSEDFVYKLDYKRIRGRKLHDYISFFEDFGWEYVDSLLFWHYFRKRGSTYDLPELYSDSESKGQIFKQLIAMISVLAIIFIPVLAFFVYMLASGKISPGPNNENLGMFIFDLLIYSFDTFVIFYALRKLIKKYRELKNRNL